MREAIDSLGIGDEDTYPCIGDEDTYPDHAPSIVCDKCGEDVGRALEGKVGVALARK